MPCQFKIINSFVFESLLYHSFTERQFRNSHTKRDLKWSYHSKTKSEDLLSILLLGSQAVFYCHILDGILEITGSAHVTATINTLCFENWTPTLFPTYWTPVSSQKPAQKYIGFLGSCLDMICLKIVKIVIPILVFTNSSAISSNSSSS